jgi:hypothetical protein
MDYLSLDIIWISSSMYSYYTISLSKDNAAARRRLPRRILKYVEEADFCGQQS